MRRVAVVGVGSTEIRSTTPDVSFKEMMFEAATKAYEDAGVDPRRDVDSFIAASEDYWEGYSIFDEFIPDQIGGVLKSVCTVTDGLFALLTGYMQICSGLFDIVAVEAHSKASDILTFEGIVAFALDPIYHRPLGGHPFYISGLEMTRYLAETDTSLEECAMVVSKNKRNALDNPYAAFGADISVEDVLDSKIMFYPLKDLEISPLADASIVMVLASEEVAKQLTDLPIWIRGVGWCSDTIQLESREWGRAVYAEKSARMAYRMAKITEPQEEIDFAEIDDKFSYKELQHMEALGLCERGAAGMLVREGVTKRDGSLPINPSGGSLGCGNLLEADGLKKAMEVVLQLRGDAGKRQIMDVETGIAQIWRGIPTASGAVAVFDNEIRREDYD